MQGLNPLPLNTPDSSARRERSGKHARELLLRDTITVLGIDQKGLIVPTRSERLPQNGHRAGLQMLSQGELGACQMVSSKGTKKPESLLQFIFN